MKIFAFVLMGFLLTNCKEAAGPGTVNPSPTPISTPEIKPSPQPTTNPRADLSPSCKAVIEGSGNGTCQATDHKFLLNLKAAQAGVPRNLFRGDGSPRDVVPYINAIIDFMDRNYGLCAFWDGQTMLVRDQKNYNEYYRMFSPNMVADPFYKTSCEPAQKFGSRNDSLDAYNPDPSCPLPRSNIDETTTCEMAGGKGSAFATVVNSSLDEIIAEQRAKPTFMFFKDDTERVEWIEKDKEQAYLARMVEKLQARGLCAMMDGGQGVSMKKGSNSRSEFWALRIMGTEDEEGRHPIWRKFHSSCVPAEF